MSRSLQLGLPLGPGAIFNGGGHAPAAGGSLVCYSVLHHLTPCGVGANTHQVAALLRATMSTSACGRRSASALDTLWRVKPTSRVATPPHHDYCDALPSTSPHALLCHLEHGSAASGGEGMRDTLAPTHPIDPPPPLDPHRLVSHPACSKKHVRHRADTLPRSPFPGRHTTKLAPTRNAMAHPRPCSPSLQDSTLTTRAS